MTTEKYMDLRDEIEDTILADMVNAVPYEEDVYSEEIVDDALEEMFSGEDLGAVDKIIRRDAIRGVLANLQLEIDDFYNTLSLNMDDYEEAISEEEMAEWVDSTYILPVWFVVRHAVHKFWQSFRQEETK